MSPEYREEEITGVCKCQHTCLAHKRAQILALDQWLLLLPVPVKRSQCGRWHPQPPTPNWRRWDPSYPQQERILGESNRRPLSAWPAKHMVSLHLILIFTSKCRIKQCQQPSGERGKVVKILSNGRQEWQAVSDTHPRLRQSSKTVCLVPEPEVFLKE